MRLFLLVMLLALFGIAPAAAQPPTITRVASGLNNPRGVTVMPDGRLVVIEAGIGADQPGEAVGSGQISIFTDNNGDGDYDDAGERAPLFTQFPSYNSLALFRTGHDEPFGLSDVLLMDDGRIFFNKDDPYAIPGHRGEDGFRGATGVYMISVDGSEWSEFAKRIATVNAIVYDPQREFFFITESGLNRLTAISLDGEDVYTFDMPYLDHDQQPVPSGVALDPLTGDVLVALFSGFVHAYFGGEISFMPGDAKIVRVNPETGTISDAIAGLTTAIDVATDPDGNIFVAELNTVWPTALMPYDFDLFDPAQPPDPGGYTRYSGRVTLYLADGSEPIILAEYVDTPTNLTYHDGRLYVSSGLGTPGRNVWTRDGVVPITGAIDVISGF